MGRLKNGVLLDLVQNHVIFSCDLHSGYALLTKIGYDLIALAKKDKLSWDLMIALSKSALIIGMILKNTFYHIGRKINMIDGLHKQCGSSIIAQPYDQEDK